MCAATMTEQDELTVNEVAKILRVSRYTVINRITEGKLRARQEGREWRIRRSDLDEYRRSTQYEPKRPE